MVILNSGVINEDEFVTMSMDNEKNFVVFKLNESRFALPLGIVERVERAVAVTLLPQAPAIVMGIINYKGAVLPVIDIRARFRLPVRPVELSDQFIILNTLKRRISLIVEDVIGHVEIAAADWVSPDEIIHGAAFLQGVLRLADGVMLIPDIEKIMTPQEDEVLSVILEKNGAPELAPPSPPPRDTDPRS